MNNSTLTKNSTENQQNNTYIGQYWLAWFKQQYHLENSPHLDELVQQVFNELDVGNSAYLVADTHIPTLTMLQQGYYHLPSTEIASQIASVVSQPRPFIFDGEALALYRYWLWEYQLAQRIIALSTASAQHQYPQEQLQSLKAQLNVDDEYQRQAIDKAISQSFTLITGGPGTGKTFTLAQIIALLVALNPKIRIAMSAPTGKASQRMQEALQNAIKALPPALKQPRLEQQQTMTLHRLLGLGHQQHAKYHRHHPLPYDVVVVDEASMLDLNLARQLFNAIADDCRLILLGDIHQLASVDVGSVLADLQSLAILTSHRQHLVHSRRFHQDSKIGQIAQWLQQRFQLTTEQRQHDNAVQQLLDIVPATTLNPHSIQQQQVQLAWIEPHNTLTHYDCLMQGFQPFIEQLKEHQSQLQRWTNTSYIHYPEQHIIEQLCTAFDSYRLLTSTQHGTFGFQQLNHYAEQWIQQQLQPHKTPNKFHTWYIGKAVMMTYNDYQLGLSNGDIGLCLYRQQDSFFVYFPSLNRWFPASRLPNNIQPAFALTIHKSQGSEFQHTAIILDDTAERLLGLELFYTAITRAKTQLSILTTPNALRLSLQQNNQRVSRLKHKVEYLNQSVD